MSKSSGEIPKTSSHVEGTEEEEARTFVALCNWGVNIGGTVDMAQLEEYSKTLPGVVAVEANMSYCTTSGAEVIKSNMKEHNCNRLVMASWTPKTHEPVFGAVLEEINLDPSYLEFVNIREHCSYVHKEDREVALEVAKDLVKSGVYRSQKNEFVPKLEVPITQSVLVIGAGVGGIRAALDLADQGIKVYLVEKEPTIGGKMSMLDRTFPTDDCSIWILGPEMLEANRNENIEILSLAEVDRVTGYIGNFEVDILQHPRYVKQSCNGCGACLEVCPAKVGREFDQGLGSRGAIYIPFAQAVPMKAVIDMDHCIRCGACENVCNLAAINFDMKEKRIKVKVGGIVVATGWDEWKPQDGYLGYGVYDNVLSQLEYERMLAPNGPVVGHIRRPSDGKTPKNILFVQCAGSRDIKRNPWCSAGVCCMVSIKNANLSRDHGIDPTVAYIDIRAGGKNYEEYYKRIRQAGVKFIRSKISQIREDKKTKNLKVLIDEDTTYGLGKLSELTFDMVVISTAMAPSKGQAKLVERLNITSGPNGFLDEYHSRLNPVDTRIPGISLAGASQAPKSIAETIMQAKGTSSSMGKLINVGKYSIELIRALHDVDSCCKCQNCLKVCPFHAISINKEGNIEVDEILCTGCGLCVSVCPNEAITVRYYRDEQFNQQIDAFLDNL